MRINKIITSNNPTTNQNSDNSRRGTKPANVITIRNFILRKPDATGEQTNSSSGHISIYVVTRVCLPKGFSVCWAYINTLTALCNYLQV